MSLFLQNIKEHQELFKNLHHLDPSVNLAVELIVSTLINSKKLMICGNGGSAADSQHIAAEFTGRFVKDRPPIAAMALSVDSSALTCIGNDYSFADIFSRQVGALAQPGDCLMGISTSGNSENVINAINLAKEMNVSTIGLIGRDGGRLKAICDVSIIVSSDVTARIQEAHILIGHSICGAVERGLGLV